MLSADGAPAQGLLRHDHAPARLGRDGTRDLDRRRHALRPARPSGPPRGENGMRSSAALLLGIKVDACNERESVLIGSLESAHSMAAAVLAIGDRPRPSWPTIVDRPFLAASMH